MCDRELKKHTRVRSARGTEEITSAADFGWTRILCQSSSFARSVTCADSEEQETTRKAQLSADGSLLSEPRRLALGSAAGGWLEALHPHASPTSPDQRPRDGTRANRRQGQVGEPWSLSRKA